MSDLSTWLPVAEFADQYPQFGSVNTIYRLIDDREHNGLSESGALGRTNKWMLHPDHFEAWIQERARAAA